MFSKRLIIPIIMISSAALTLAGCQETSGKFTVSTVQTASEVVGNSPPLTSINFAELSDNKTANNGQQNSITREMFIKAFNQLYSKLPGKDSIEYIEEGFSTPIIDFYSSGNGDRYIFASSQYYRARGIIIVFKNNGPEYIPIHMEKFNDILESVRFLPASIGTSGLLEVITHDGLGTGRNRKVQLFSIETTSHPDFTENFKMSRVWHYTTISNSIDPVAGTKDTYEYNFNYASYTVIPTYLFPIIEKHDTPIIVLSDTHEVFTAQGDEQKLISDKKITNTQKTFIWDSYSNKFIEKK